MSYSWLFIQFNIICPCCINSNVCLLVVFCYITHCNLSIHMLADILLVKKNIYIHVYSHSYICSFEVFTPGILFFSLPYLYSNLCLAGLVNKGPASRVYNLRKMSPDKWAVRQLSNREKPIQVGKLVNCLL